MFGNEKIDTPEFSGGKYLTFGNQVACITGFTVKASKANDAWQVILHIEGPTEADPNFKADDKAIRGGLVGNVKLENTYYKTSDQLKNFDARMQLIGKKAGVEDALVNAKAGATSVEDYMNRVLPLLKGKDICLQVGAEEYAKQDGKVGKAYFLPRYGFVASMAEGLAHLKPFSKTDKYMYVALETEGATNDVPAVSDAPSTSQW